MLMISRITTQKKNNKRFNIYLSDGKKEFFGLSIGENVLIKYRLRKGLEVSEQDITAWKTEDANDRVYFEVLNYINYRMRTEKEVRDYLVGKDVSVERINRIIQHLKDKQFIQDENYAEQFVRMRINSSMKGPYFIKQELIQKGIDEGKVEKALEQYLPEIQLEKIKKIIQKRLRQKSNHSYRYRILQTQAYLERNGFSNEFVKEALQTFEGVKDEEEERKALVHHGEKLWKRHEKNYTGKELIYKVKEGLFRRGFSLHAIDQFVQRRNNEDM